MTRGRTLNERASEALDYIEKRLKHLKEEQRQHTNRANEYSCQISWLQEFRSLIALWKARAEKAEAALGESVKLQSHYAGLLNIYDGGERMQFATADAWMERLAALKENPNG